MWVSVATENLTRIREVEQLLATAHTGDNGKNQRATKGLGVPTQQKVRGPRKDVAGSSKVASKPGTKVARDCNRRRRTDSTKRSAFLLLFIRP
jgi:hypothetical protein